MVNSYIIGKLRMPGKSPYSWNKKIMTVTTRICKLLLFFMTESMENYFHNEEGVI